MLLRKTAVLAACAASVSVAASLAAPAVAAAKPGDPSDLWTYADGVTERMEKQWSKKQNRYTGSPFRLTVSMLALFSNARIAHYQGGPSRNDERIEPLARLLITWPTYITKMSDARRANATHPHAPGFTSGTGDKPGYQHVAISNLAMESLGLAVKSGALPRKMEEEIGRKVYAVARGPRFRYPHVEANQVNWQIGAWLGTARATGRWGQAGAQTRAYLRSFVAGMRKPMPGYVTPNLTSGYGLNYFPEVGSSMPINQTSSTEYASVIFSGFDFYDDMIKHGMRRLSYGQEARLRRWAKRIVTGEWTHGGWPNWDTGYGYERWQLVNYFAWCTEALGTIAASNRLVGDTDRRRARWLLRQALARYRWLVDRGQKTSTRYGVGSSFTRPTDNLITDVRMGATASAAALNEVGSAGSTPDGWSWWDGSRRRLTVSNPAYSSAMITPVNRIGYGGLEPARFLDSQGRVITSLGSTISQAGMRASARGHLVGLTQGRYSTVLRGVKQWRPRKVGSGSPKLTGRAGAIIVNQRFSPEAITTRYQVRASNARTQLRIPFWGKLTRREVTKIKDGLKIETENSEGAKVEILVRSQRPIRGSWGRIAKVRCSPKTRTIFRISGSSSGGTRTSVVMRPLS